MARWGGVRGWLKLGLKLVEVGVGCCSSLAFLHCVFFILFYHAIIPYKTIGENKHTHVTYMVPMETMTI